MKKSTVPLKTIDMKGEQIKYSLHSNQRSKSMRLTVYPDGRIAILAPSRMSQGLIEKFLKNKSDWILGKIAYFKKFNGALFLGGGKRDYLKFKEQARSIAHDRLAYFNQSYNFTYHRITIRNQKSRWGSCSGRGNLNFNYKIARIDPALADYVIVHELCHLGEFNHSKKFWDLVSQTIPNHKELRSKLKREVILV